jgi:hypothetical protein
LINIQINKVKELTDTEKKGHMASLGARKPETRNTLRITETHFAVTAELAALEKATAAQVGVAYSLSVSYQKITTNWGLVFSMWLPEELKPKESFSNYQWDLRMVATVAILSKATPGQGHIIKDIIKGVAGGQGVLTEQDVLRTITHIYERAGLIALQVCSSILLV